jgi:uncharacterized membrane protein YjgN (DUF898 family)
LNPQPTHSPKRSPARLAALAGWAPALFVLAALAARLIFIFSLGLFWVHYKRQALVLAVQAGLCALLVWLARRGAFRRLAGAGRAVRWAFLAAVAAGCAGWVLLACYGLEPPDLIFETAWAAALGTLMLAALWPRAPWPQLALSVATCALLVVAARPFVPVAAQTPASFGTLQSIGAQLYTQWLAPFEAVSLLLLVAMVGAVVVAKSRV